MGFVRYKTGFRRPLAAAALAAWCAVANTGAPRLAAAGNPSDLFVYEMAGASKANRVAMATVMGIVNRTSPEMYMAYQASPSVGGNPKAWLDRYVATQPQTAVHWNSAPSYFLNKYRSSLNGYVLYDEAGAHINEATSVAGVLNAVAVTPSLEATAIAAGLTKIEDVRTRDTASIYAQYGSQFNRDAIVSLDPIHGHELRDFAVQNRALTYWNPPSKSTYLAAQNENTQIYGWDVSEQEFFGSASANNLKAVAANYSQGYSALSQWTVAVPPQPNHASASPPAETGVHYVAFVMSDGDNAQWLTNGFADDPKWFGSPHRGSFTMNWDLSPDMLKIAPIVVKNLYERASQGAAQDYFVTAHGPGTDYPSQVPDYAGSVAVTAASMQAVDQKILSVLDDAWRPDRFDQILDNPAISGGMFKSNWGAGYAGMNGQIYWHNGKPMISAKYSLWDGFGSAASISSALNAAPRNPLADQASYSVVNVHPWSTGGLGDPMSNLDDLVSRLDPNVRVVTMEELVNRLKFNLSGTAGQPVAQIANGTFESGANGWFDSTNSYEAVYQGDAASGSKSIGFTTTTQANIAAPGTWADWRSTSFAVQPGDVLVWSYSYRTSATTVGEVLAELRGFSNSSLSTFVQEDATQLAGTDGTWQRVTKRFVVPAGVTAMDLRFNNIFTNILDPFRGEFRLDDVAVWKSGASEDLNGDGAVNGADLSFFKAGFGRSGAVIQGDGDANADQIVDGADFLRWQRRASLATTAAATSLVSEPTAGALLLAASIVAGLASRRGN